MAFFFQQQIEAPPREAAIARLREIMGFETCPTEEAIAAYVAGSLGIVERSRIDAHLARCPECEELVAGVRKLEAWWATKTKGGGQ
jgi:hypothetical protein